MEYARPILAIFFTLKVTARLSQVLLSFIIYILRLMRILYKTDHCLNQQSE